MNEADGEAVDVDEDEDDAEAVDEEDDVDEDEAVEEAVEADEEEAVVAPLCGSRSKYRRSAAAHSGSIQLCCLRIDSSSGAHAVTPPRRAARASE